MKNHVNGDVRALIQAGFLKPGDGRVSCQSHGVKYVADLLPSGAIRWNGETFDSLSYFSLTIKKIRNPNRLADSGWSSVWFLDDNGKEELLNAIRTRYKEGLAKAGGSSQQPTTSGPKSAAAVPQPLSQQLTAAPEAPSELTQLEATAPGAPTTAAVPVPAPSDTTAGEPPRRKRKRVSLRPSLADEPSEASSFISELSGSEEDGEDSFETETSDAEWRAERRRRGLARSQQCGTAGGSGRPAGPQQQLAEQQQAGQGPQGALQPAGRQAASGSRKRGRPPKGPASQQALSESPRAAPAFVPARKREPLSPPSLPELGIENAAEYEWVNCDRCKKWRKEREALLPDGVWDCSMNSDERFRDCSLPQELSDAEIDALTERVRHYKAARFAHESERPALQDCTDAEFRADFMAFLSFLDSRDGTSLASLAQNAKCNNLPLDFFNLYKAVVSFGGYISTARFEGQKYAGDINFAGGVFPRLRNFTADNRATSIGHMLRTNYEKYLLAYERAYRDYEDEAEAPQLRAAEAPAAVASTGGAGAAGVGAKGGAARGAAGATTPRARPPRRRPPPKVKAEVEERVEPETSEEDMLEVDLAMLDALADAAEQAAQGSSKLEAACPGDSSAATASADPGALLLAPDPHGRLWPVVVAGFPDLPRAVALGGVHPAGAAFPLPRSTAAPGDPRLALPVLVLGTERMGWVHRSAVAGPYSRQAGSDALRRVLARAEDASLAPALREDPDNAACAAALKMADQLAGTAGCGHLQAAGMAGEVAVRLLAERLAGLEARLPLAALASADYLLWASWRRTLRRAEGPAELVPQVLLLAHQLQPQALLPGAAERLWQQLRTALDMGLASTEALSASGGVGLGCGPITGPRPVAIDSAITAIEDAVAWEQMAQLWRPDLPQDATAAAAASEPRKSPEPRRRSGSAGGEAPARRPEPARVRTARPQDSRMNVDHLHTAEAARAAKLEHSSGSESSEQQPLPEPQPLLMLPKQQAAEPPAREPQHRPLQPQHQQQRLSVPRDALAPRSSAGVGGLAAAGFGLTSAAEILGAKRATIPKTAAGLY